MPRAPPLTIATFWFSSMRSKLVVEGIRVDLPRREAARTRYLQPVARLEASCHIGAGAAPRHVAHVEGKLVFIGRMRHRVVTRKSRRELKLGVLAGGKSERAARLDGDTYAFDVVR